MVGVSIIGTGLTLAAFVWDGVNGMTDLNDLLIGPTDWHLNQALAINSSGQIVGSGEHNGVSHGFLLTPVTADAPGPTTLSLFGLGLSGIGALR